MKNALIIALMALIALPTSGCWDEEEEVPSYVCYHGSGQAVHCVTGDPLPQYDRSIRGVMLNPDAAWADSQNGHLVAEANGNFVTFTRDRGLLYIGNVPVEDIRADQEGTLFQGEQTIGFVALVPSEDGTEVAALVNRDGRPFALEITDGRLTLHAVGAPRAALAPAPMTVAQQTVGAPRLPTGTVDGADLFGGDLTGEASVVLP